MADWPGLSLTRGSAWVYVHMDEGPCWLLVASVAVSVVVPVSSPLFFFPFSV